ncbi:PilZ domain-containing protein [Neisseriaceae bacterium ESL0693]|nr:PilZ domain-containing protein [Neisseriaceae bacterium ESL0693]
MSDAPVNLPGKMLNLSIPDKPELYRSYMSFLQFGGLFARTTDKFQMGDEVLLALNLPSLNEPKFLRTHIVWINRSNTADGQPQGIGMAFGSDAESIEVKRIIEDLLPGLLLNEHPTYTL